MSSKLNLNSILHFSINGGKERKYDRADRKMSDIIIRVYMNYYIVYFIRIIIYFVNGVIYVQSIFSYNNICYLRNCICGWTNFQQSHFNCFRYYFKKKSEFAFFYSMFLAPVAW